ncbi:epoxide hydrolase 3 isoform 2 [Mus musculus]|uniref:Epoxide hydrolase 3 n=1 Tax=Mus musculus TaxID=10090 RepID=G3XA19_MOUSE|nr:epoxide hydrolase 3 isoform 2 [Mus musculus]EDL40330.1 mCG14254 [Mus musculus]|eukprot:XP_006525019.1 PREDICTED: epoxide hydrolase 3 isoform X1 [Mus musculus]
MRGGSICPSRASVSSTGPVDSDSTVESQNKGGGLLAPAPLAQSPDHGGSVVVPERKDMPEFVVTALLAPSRLSLKLLRALVMSLVYLAALVAAFVYSCIALTHVMCRPRRGCCGRQRLSPPECLRDPTLGEHCFLTLRSSGLRLHYVSAGHGNGPLMLFLHGFPENWFSWRYQLREFQSHFHVVAVDMRGYSPSDAPKEVDCYTIDLLLDDIKDTILGLGYSKCILVSHDWGASLAWEFSIYYPSLVERMVVANGPPMSVIQEYSIHHIGQIFRSNYMFLFQLPWLPEKLLSMSDFQILKDTFTHRKNGIPGLTPSELEAFLYHFSQPGCLTGPINYYRNVFRNFPLEPKKLSTPTLLLWGEKDFAFQQGLVEAIGRHFVPGRLESHILPGSGHWIPQSHPQEMHQYMWAFLQDLLG